MHLKFNSLLPYSLYFEEGQFNTIRNKTLSVQRLLILHSFFSFELLMLIFIFTWHFQLQFARKNLFKQKQKFFENIYNKSKSIKTWFTCLTYINLDFNVLKCIHFKLSTANSWIKIFIGTLTTIFQDLKQSIC